MKYLRAQFEEQLQITLDPDGNAKVGETVLTPAAVLSADETAYKAEFDAWLSDVWLPEQEARLQEIMDLHANRKRFSDLCAAIRNEQVVPLVGSGMSVPSGLLPWSDFLRSIRQHSTLPAEELEELLQASRFEEAADRLSATMPARLFNERIEHDLRPEELAALEGPINHLPAIFPVLALTTNLDEILEQLYEREERPWGHVLAGTEIDRYRALKAPSETFLLKLHGDHRRSKGRVLGKAEYDRAYAPGGVVFQELALLFRTKSLLFLGCSLGADRTIQLLADVAAGDPNLPKHYTFLRAPSSDGARLVREHFLTERGIFPIWYRGDHDSCIEALLVGILRQLGRL